VTNSKDTTKNTKTRNAKIFWGFASFESFVYFAALV